MASKCTLVLLISSLAVTTGCDKRNGQPDSSNVAIAGQEGYAKSSTRQATDKCCVDYRDEVTQSRLLQRQADEEEKARQQDQALFKPVSRFERIVPSGWPGAEFVLSRDGARWRVEIVVGAEPAGIATKADCRMILIGHMKNGRLVVGPNKETSIAADYVRGSVVQMISINGNFAKILDNNSSAYCDGPYYAKGVYKKSGKNR